MPEVATAGSAMQPLSAHPRLVATATAVPNHVLRREEVMMRARIVFNGRAQDMDRLMPVYANAGIDNRYSCVPIEWYLQPCGWAERNRLFLHHALALTEQAARRCLDEAGLTAGDVDIVVAVSTSGIATPSLDAHLVNRLGLRPDVQRLPIFGLGCAGGVLGLGRAAAMARAHPGARVLLTVVECCGLTFRSNDQSKSNIIATALFGDGAAAALISCRADSGPRLTAWGERTWPQTLDVMGWRIEDNGFGVLFSSNIPTIVRDRYRAALDGFLADHGRTVADIDGWLCHPGGAKVVTALEAALDLQSGSLRLEREILRQYGNMSAATLLFVIDRALRAGVTGRHVATALGPGFTAGFLMLEGP